MQTGERPGCLLVLTRVPRPVVVTFKLTLPRKRRRKIYDATGSIEDAEELAGDQFNDLYNYYRSMYAKASTRASGHFNACPGPASFMLLAADSRWIPLECNHR